MNKFKKYAHTLNTYEIQRKPTTFQVGYENLIMSANAENRPCGKQGRFLLGVTYVLLKKIRAAGAR